MQSNFSGKMFVKMVLAMTFRLCNFWELLLTFVYFYVLFDSL